MSCELSAKSQSYAVVTLHRPSNVDDKEKLKGILSALKEISKDMVIYFPMHPRTKKNIKQFSLSHVLKSSNIKIMKPLSYLQFLKLWKDACLVLTDSGGIQEETTALGIPCFTIRENTERPITIHEGTNTLVGSTGKGILKAYRKFKKDQRLKGQEVKRSKGGEGKSPSTSSGLKKDPSTGTSSEGKRIKVQKEKRLKGKRPKLWDGKTAERIINILLKKK
jgi:UDP-N-acetylglucosamine 2-epimerase (non-hydrolysing)